jgi:hypothetical protein
MLRWRYRPSDRGVYIRNDWKQHFWGRGQTCSCQTWRFFCRIWSQIVVLSSSVTLESTQGTSHNKFTLIRRVITVHTLNIRTKMRARTSQHTWNSQFLITFGGKKLYKQKTHVLSMTNHCHPLSPHPLTVHFACKSNVNSAKCTWSMCLVCESGEPQKLRWKRWGLVEKLSKRVLWSQKRLSI